MGVHPNIDYNKFPKQGDWLHKRTQVLFNYGGTGVMGTIIRDDYEHLFTTLILLDDGRVVNTTECQYQPTDEIDELAKEDYIYARHN